MSISFHSADVKIPLRQRDAVKRWLESAAGSEKCRIGKIDYIFCSDHYLHHINLQFLKHDDYTDIITFDYTEGRVLNGEIYISAERVKDNASVFGVPYSQELCRVLVHGFLHLAGYHDKKKGEKEMMRAKEDKYLGKLFE